MLMCLTTSDNSRARCFVYTVPKISNWRGLWSVTRNAYCLLHHHDNKERNNSWWRRATWWKYRAMWTCWATRMGTQHYCTVL